MAERWITVATFAIPEQAHIACNALRETGLPARIDDDVIVGLAWYLGTALGGVKIKVPPEHVAAAREFLGYADDDEGAPDDDEAAAARPRVDRPAACPACGERTQAGFDLCWNCGAELASEGPSTITTPDDSETSAASSGDLADDIADDAEPSPAEDHDSPPSLSAAQLTDRAWKAAVVGLIICPGFLQVYSIWNLLQAAAAEDLDDRGSSWKWYGALIINLITMGYAAILLRFFVAWELPPLDWLF